MFQISVSETPIKFQSNRTIKHKSRGFEILRWDVLFHVVGPMLTTRRSEELYYLGPFYWHGLTLYQYRDVINYAHYKTWDEITHPFPYFNGCTVEVMEGISNSIPHFTGLVITQTMLVTGGPVFYGCSCCLQCRLQIFRWVPGFHELSMMSQGAWHNSWSAWFMRFS